MMKKQTKKKLLAGLMIAFGIIGIICEIVLVVTYEKYLSREWTHPGTRWNYLAFFTEITNIMVDLWLIMVGIAIMFDWKRKYKFWTKPQIQGAITLYILVVGVIYCGVLFWFTVPYSSAYWWGNVINVWHHLVVPTVMIIMFWNMPHSGHVSMKILWYWMIYPVTYLLFSELRGLIDGWYPYIFLDPHTPLFPIGLITAVIFIAGFGYALLWIHNAKADKAPALVEAVAEILAEDTQPKISK